MVHGNILFVTEGLTLFDDVRRWFCPWEGAPQWSGFLLTLKNLKNIFFSIFENPAKSDSGSGIKRASDQSTTEDQPAPKKSNVPSSERELREGETRESFPIPDQLVGLVIGRGGENIQRVQVLTFSKLF